MGIFDKIFGKGSSSNKTSKTGRDDVLVDKSAANPVGSSTQFQNAGKIDVLVDQSVTRLIEIYKQIPEGKSKRVLLQK